MEPEFNVRRVQQFHTTPEAEALGGVMMAWLDNLLVDVTRPALAARGIEEIDPEKWYNYQTFLDAMRDIIEGQDNVMSTLVAIGKSAADTLPIENFESMEAFKGFMKSLHPSVVRNYDEAEGFYFAEADGELYLLNNIPNSNDLTYGFLWQVLAQHTIGGKKYLLEPYADYPSLEVGSIFHITHDD